MSEDTCAVTVIWPFVGRLPRFNRRSIEARALKGACLAPYLVDGDVVFFDRTLEAQDGDLVMVGMLYQLDRGGMIVAHQKIVRCDAVKQLRIIGEERFLCAADGAVSADAGHEVLGPVTGWYRRAWWRRPSPRKADFSCSGSRVRCAQPSPE